MSLQQLLQSRKIQQHQTSRNELDELRALVDRDLKDAAIKELSADRRFVVAYNAVLQLAKMILQQIMKYRGRVHYVFVGKNEQSLTLCPCDSH